MPDEGQEVWQFNDILVTGPETRGLQFDNMLIMYLKNGIGVLWVM
jgi:hypothetical protein